MQVWSARSAAVRLLFQLLDVGTGNKRAPCANQDDGTNRRAICGSPDTLGNAFWNTWTQRVDRRIFNCNHLNAAFHTEFDKFGHERKLATKTTKTTKLNFLFVIFVLFVANFFL